MKVNFEHFKAACALVGLQCDAPERKDAQHVWIYRMSSADVTARARAQEVADGFGIAPEHRLPKRKVHGDNLKIAVAAFDHVPLQRVRMVEETVTLSNGSEVTYRRRERV